MKTRNVLSDAKVGAFVLTALAVVIVGSLWVAGSQFFSPERVEWVVVMEDSGGLQKGDLVRVAGVRVGRVQRVELRPEGERRVAMTVSVDRQVDLRADASASIGTAGLMGAGFLALDPGSAEAEPLFPGGTIAGRRAMGIDDALESVEELSAKASSLLDQLGEILEQTSGDMARIMSGVERLLSDENVDNFEGLLAGARGTLDEAGPQLTSLLERFDVLVDTVELSVDGLPGTADQLDGLIADLRRVTGPEGERISSLVDDLQSTLRSAEDALGAVGGSRGDIEASLRDLRDTLANLKSFTQQVKEKPYSLIRVVPPEDRSPGDGVKENAP